MKKVIRNIVSVLFLAFVIVMVYPQSAQAAVKLNKTSATLFVGESVQLRVSGTSQKVTWKSGNTKVATVSSKGKVVAKKSGNATITATVSGKSYKCNLKVNSSFKLNAKSVSIKNTKVLNAYLSANGGVKYYPANPKTCTITFGKWNGDYLPITIEPKKVGTETIRFTNTANKEEWQLTI
ncbi:MAG: Ig-like domain-containing protein, partial [bacterium]|nr:Ig-like domain-containing protein [bacterium]